MTMGFFCLEGKKPQVDPTKRVRGNLWLLVPVRKVCYHEVKGGDMDAECTLPRLWKTI